MDIDFIIQDTFAYVRPQWKLATNFDEAGRIFADMVKQNYKVQDPEKTTEADDADDGVSSDGDPDDEAELPVPGMDDGQSSDDEAEPEIDVSPPQTRSMNRSANFLRSLMPVVTQSVIPTLKKTLL